MKILNSNIKYISFEEAIEVYAKTIEKSGGGFSGVRDEGGIDSALAFIQNDDYYPDFGTKLTELVYRFCKGHYFNDGNKRIAITLGAYFLHQNKLSWPAVTFMKRMEAIIYHVAAGNIEKELLSKIMVHIIDSTDFDEELKLEIAYAMAKEDNFNLFLNLIK